MTRLIRRRALLIGNERYDDSRFAPLPSTQADVWQLRQVLEHRNIGAFASVSVAVDLTADDMRCAVGEFLEDRDPDELAVLYFTGHGARVVQAGGEFYVVAKDTDFDRIAETGVSAGFVNERLEQCWAPQKVVMIDCCRSGGFAVGLRTADQRTAQPTAKSAEQPLLTSRGVYVLSSSRAGEDSYSGAANDENVQPSAFTAEVVEALRTGKVGKDGTGEVSVDDLFQYVNRRMRAQGGQQVPVKSAHGVDDRIIIAGCPLGGAPRLAPLARRQAATPESRPPAPAAKAVRSQPAWGDLLEYYRQCVLAENVDMPLLSPQDHDTSHVCLSGAERLLSGDLDEDGCAALPKEAAALVEDAADQQAELWAGYPAVLVNGPPGRPAWRDPKFAPLLIRRVEVVRESGETRLKPYGPVLPHPRLARDWLGEEDATQLIDTYQPSWQAGQHDRMAVDARNLITQDYELPCVQELRPDQLADQLDIRTPTPGARNVAVLFLAPRDVKATKKLLDDLNAVSERLPEIAATALAALSPDPAERARALAHQQPDTTRLVTPLPCNEAQEAVLRAAMTRRLTVATGPPGTGKSQLVANLVATAVANGQSVLVASTNNEAVDEVWRRCESLSPGSVVRTGSSSGKTDYTEMEAVALQALRAAPAAERNVATASMDLTVARDRLERVRQEHVRVARAERALRQAGEARERHATRLGLSPAQVADVLSSASSLDQLARQATRLAHARFLGGWRRARFLRRLPARTPAGGHRDACVALAELATAESVWRAEIGTATATRDADLAAALDTAQADVQRASSTLLDSAVKTNARGGRQRIAALLTASAGRGSDWPAVRDVLPAARGWAVTSLSARRFPPQAALFDLVVVDEASQCAIPHVLPLLFRARRALIIGDAMQLTHIAKASPQNEAAIRRGVGLRSDWLEKLRLAYRRHSAFHAAERAVGGALLLDEHFRCHPDIAAVSNELFYGGELTVLTDIRGRPALARPAIVWTHVAGRATRHRRSGSWVNEDEIREVDRIVQGLVAQLPPAATIGVVTPFKGQDEELRRRLARHEPGRVRVGTVHTFQGGERDFMVLSLVAAAGMSPGAISWIHRQLNLWNVAITRARSHLVVVADAELWGRRGGVGAALLAAAADDDGGASGGEPDELVKRLCQRLSEIGEVTLGQTVNGHLADAVVRVGDGVPTAVLLDPGPAEGADEARHLRLMLRRRDLLDSGSSGAAIRHPAWRLYTADVAEQPAE